MIEKSLTVSKTNLNTIDKYVNNLKDNPTLQNLEILKKIITGIEKDIKSVVLTKLIENNLDFEEVENGKVTKVQKHKYEIVDPEALPKEWKELKKVYLQSLKLDEQVTENKSKLDLQMKNVKKEYEAFHNEIPGIAQIVTEELRTNWNNKESQ